MSLSDRTGISNYKDVQMELTKITADQSFLLETIETQVWYLINFETYGFANRAHREFLGIQCQDIFNRKLKEFLAPEIADICIASNLEAFNTRKTVQVEEWFPTKHGEYRLIKITKIPKFTSTGNVEYLVCSGIDITEEWQSRKIIARRMEFECLISRMSSKFVMMPLDDVDEGINEALASVGKFVSADRAYVFIFFEDTTRMDNTHEWCAEGIEPQIGNLKDILLDEDLPWFAKCIRERVVFHVPEVDALPVAAALERKHFEVQGIKSLIALPMVMGSRVIGFIGFDAVRSQRTWTSDEQALLGLLGESITHTLSRKWCLELLGESEENFRNFFNIMDDMIVVGTPDGRIIYVNPAVLKKLDYTQADLLGMHILDLHPPEKRQEAELIFAAMFRGELDVCPLPLQRKDGAFIPVETRAWFGKWSDVDCIYGICKDLTKEQEALQKFNRIFNSNPAPMAVTVLPDEVFSDVNEAFLNLLGYSRSEVIGRTSDELGLFLQPEKRGEIAKRLETNGHVDNCELQVTCRNGKILEGIFSGVVIESQGQRCFLTVMIDQTERKQAEEELRKSESKYQFLAESMADVVFTVDMNLMTTYVSPSVERVLGFTPKERMVLQIDEQLTPIAQKLAFKILAQELEREKDRSEDPNRSQTLVLDCYHKDGSIRHLDTYIRGMRDSQGRLIGFYGLSRDITDRKRVESALAESELKYRTLVENASDIVFQTDNSGHLTFVNKAALCILGYDENEMIGKHYLIFVKDDFRDRVGKHFNRQSVEKVQNSYLEYVIVTKNNRDIWLGQNTRLLMKAGCIDSYQAVARNITDRKRTEEVLKHELSFRNVIINSMTDGLCVCQETSTFPFIEFTIWNNRMTEITGYTIEDTKRSGLVRCFYRESDLQNRANERMKAAFGGDHICAEEWEVTSADGEQLVLSVSSTVINMHEGLNYLLALMQDITPRKKIEYELSKYRDELEQKVEDRTFELEQKAKKLEKMNIALNILLQKREEDKRIIQDTFAMNIKNLIVPYIEKVGQGKLDSQQRLCMDIIGQHLEEIVSPLVRSLHQFNLTAREVQVASLVKGGKTTKEIAEILGLAKGSIDIHRKNIRKKLALKRITNLQSHLNSLAQ